MDKQNVLQPYRSVPRPDPAPEGWLTKDDRDRLGRLKAVLDSAAMRQGWIPDLVAADRLHFYRLMRETGRIGDGR